LDTPYNLQAVWNKSYQWNLTFICNPAHGGVLAYHFNVAVLKYPFMLSHPVAILALEYCLLLYTDWH
jgi:hypothetical protein